MQQSCYTIKCYGSKTIFVPKKIPVIYFCFYFRKRFILHKETNQQNNYI